MICLEFRRRNNGQIVRQVHFPSPRTARLALAQIIEEHGLTELDNNKRDERRWSNHDGVFVVAAYDDNRSPGIVALNEARRLLK